MIKVGITGQSGFIGSHLFNTLSLDNKKYELIPFEDSFFDSEESLNNFVSNCNVIVHLAAVNRHHNPDEIYNTNVLLVEKLIKALKITGRKTKIIFASSTQEELIMFTGNQKRKEVKG